MTLQLNNATNNVQIDYAGAAATNSVLTVPEAATGTFALEGAAGGAAGNISRATLFRMSANFSTNNDTLGNWETPDGGNGEAGNITAAVDGVTQAAGVFTFPVTGFWLVQLNSVVQVGSNQGIFIETQVTTDATNFNVIASGSAGNTGGGNSNMTVSSCCLVDVTDVANVQVRFVGTGIAGTTQILGNTNQNFTSATFLRLGDT